MINKLGNNVLTMYEGDTGTISFKIIGYEEGDKNQYNRSILRLEQNLDTDELLSNVDEFTSCEILENNSSFMMIKAYK